MKNNSSQYWICRETFMRAPPGLTTIWSYEPYPLNAIPEKDRKEVISSLEGASSVHINGLPCKQIEQLIRKGIL